MTIGDDERLQYCHLNEMWMGMAGATIFSSQDGKGSGNKGEI